MFFYPIALRMAKTHRVLALLSAIGLRVCPISEGLGCLGKQIVLFIKLVLKKVLYPFTFSIFKKVSS